jgi:hypothetical protein
MEGEDLMAAKNRSDWISKNFFERIPLNTQYPLDLKIRDYKKNYYHY